MDFVFLIGPPGSGKTSTGRALAKLLQCPFFDTDELVEHKAGLSVAEIFQSQGEKRFREWEKTLVELLADDAWVQKQAGPSNQMVLATGGGLPIYNNNLEKISALGKVFALQAPLSVLLERLADSSKRPLLTDSSSEDQAQYMQEQLSELIKTRAPVYAQAGYKIDTVGLSPEQVAHEILKVLSCSDA